MLIIFAAALLAAPAEDLVTSLPGFGPWPFKTYSGYIEVPGPFKMNEYDSLSIHCACRATSLWNAACNSCDCIAPSRVG